MKEIINQKNPAQLEEPKNITLQEYLEAKFGRDRVVVTRDPYYQAQAGEVVLLDTSDHQTQPERCDWLKGRPLDWDSIDQRPWVINSCQDCYWENMRSLAHDDVKNWENVFAFRIFMDRQAKMTKRLSNEPQEVEIMEKHHYLHFYLCAKHLEKRRPKSNNIAEGAK